MYQRSGSSAPQKRAKAPIASSGKPTPAKPKAGLQKMAVRLKPTASSRVKQLQQAPERKIGDDQKACRGSHQQGVAAKGNAVELMDDAGVDDHHHHEDGEERRQFSDERRERAAAGCPQPGSQAAS